MRKNGLFFPCKSIHWSVCGKDLIISPLLQTRNYLHTAAVNPMGYQTRSTTPARSLTDIPMVLVQILVKLKQMIENTKLLRPYVQLCNPSIPFRLLARINE